MSVQSERQQGRALESGRTMCGASLGSCARHVLFGLLAAVLGCEKEADEAGDAADVDATQVDAGAQVDAGGPLDAWLTDATFPDAELDPCVPRVVGESSFLVYLLAAGSELFAVGDSHLWPVRAGGWLWSAMGDFYGAWAGRDRVWALTHWDVVTALGPDGRTQVRRDLDFEGEPSGPADFYPEALIEADDGSLLLAGQETPPPEALANEEYNGQARLIAFDTETGEERWRAGTLPFEDDSSLSVFEVAFVASDGRIYAAGSVRPFADQAHTLLMSFEPLGDRLSFARIAADRLWPQEVAESGGQAYVLGVRDGQVVIVPFGRPEEDGLLLPVDAALPVSEVARFWSLPDGWLVVTDLLPADPDEEEGGQVRALRLDLQGAVRWEQRYADPQGRRMELSGAAWVSDRLHLLMSAQGLILQAALDLEGRCQVAPRLVLPVTE
jgi:hypothetical protein